MAGDISLRVVTPVRLVLEEQVDELTAPGPLGQLGILPDHAALMTTLDIGQLSYKPVRAPPPSSPWPAATPRCSTTSSPCWPMPPSSPTRSTGTGPRTPGARAERSLGDSDHFDDEDLVAARAALQRALVRLETAGYR